MIKIKTNNSRRLLFFSGISLFVSLLSLFFLNFASTPVEALTCPSGCEANVPLNVCTGPGGCVSRVSCYASEFDAGFGYCCDICEPDCGSCGSCTPSTPSGYTTTNTGCSSTTNSCTRYDGCGSCGTTTWTFWLLKYTLTYTASAGGTLSGTTSQSVCRGSNGTAVTAVPNGGYAFSQWSDGSTANPRIETDVTANLSFNATFVLVNTAPTAPTSLLAEGATNPTGVTDTTPEFSAIFNDSNAGNTGTYYEIEVNTNSSFTGTVMWDSGQVSMTSTAIGARSPNITYAGTELSLNGTTYYWRIRFTDNYGAVGTWSSVANFTMNTAPAAPTSLLSEGATNPVGVTDTTPEFSAIFNDSNSGNTADFYEIEVNTNSSFTGTVMWDSGQVPMVSTAIGSRSPDFSYTGIALTLNGTTYYWRIRFTDSHGTVGSWSSTATFAMNTAPSAPTSLLIEAATNPTGITDTTPEFSAIFNDPNSGNTASYYEIEVNTNSSFTGTVMWDTGQVPMLSIAIGARSPDVSYSGSALSLNGSTYYWRIRFTDNYGTVGSWSSTANFNMNTTPGIPTTLLTEGVNNPTRVTDLTPEFSAEFDDLDIGDMGVYYEIDVNTNPSFTGTVMWSSGQTAMTPTASGTKSPDIPYNGTLLVLNGTTYYWRIRFTDNHGTVSSWSTVANFRMNTTPNSPLTPFVEGVFSPTRVIDTTPEFSALFSDPDGDTGNYYEIEVNTNSSFTGTVMWDSGQIATTPIASGSRSTDIPYNGVPLTLNGTTYYWRIRFWDSNNTVSNWTNGGSFTMNRVPDAPSSLQTDGLVNPTQLTNLTPSFTAIHTDADNDPANYYEVEVNTNSSFTGTVMWDSGQISMPNLINNLRSSAITYNGSTLNQDGTTYYWRIRFWDTSGSVSNWSATNTFRTLDLPGTPTNLVGQALSTTSIRWSFTDNANGEQGIKIYDQDNTLVKTCTGENITYCDETTLSENTQYTRYAVAYNTEADSSGSNTDSVYTLISVPTLQYQGSKTSSSITILASQPVNGGELYFDCEGDCDTNLNTWTTTNSANVTGLTNNTGYTFRVKARNNDNIETSYSTDLNIYTHAPIPTLTAGPLSTTSISLSGTGVQNLSAGDSGIFFDCTIEECDTGIQDWVKSTTDVAINLQPNSEYSFRVKARNYTGEETSYSSEVAAWTLAVVPSIENATTLNSSQIDVQINKETNPNHTELLLQETYSGMYVNLSTGLLEPTPVWGHLDGLTPTITVSGLQSGITYTFRVKARNMDLIETAYSATQSSTTALSNITALTPTVNSDSQITWRISAYSDTVLGIKVYNESGDLLKTCLGDGITSCTEDSLQTNTTYTRKFKIYNNIAESDFSNTVQGSTFAQTPAIFDIQQGNYDAESITVKIDIKENPEVTKYLIEEKTSGLYLNSETQLLQESPYYSTYTQLGLTDGITIYGLNPNITYTFRAKAQNIDLVDTAFSGEQTVTTLSNSPSIVSVEAIDTTTVKVVVNNGGNNDTTLYNLLETISNKSVDSASLTSQTLWKTYEEIGGFTGLNIQNLSPNTLYTFCVKAKNIENIQTPCSQSLSAYTLSKTSTLTTRVTGSSSIEITVNKNGNPTNTTYQLLEVTTNGNIDNENRFTNSTVLHTDTRVTSNFTLSNLPPNTTYTFKVRTVNSDNVYSQWSENVTVTTWANTPKDLTFETIGGSTGRIKFDRNTNPSSTRFAIQEKNSGKYLDYSTQTLVDSPVWGSYTSWGGTSGIIFRNLEPGVQYSFRAKAINSSNVETNYVESNTGKTYSIIVNKPEEITTALVDNTQIDVSTIDGAQTGTQKVRVLTDEYIVADLPISFTDNRDWSNAIIKSSPSEGKSVVKINQTHGLTDKFTMYVVKKDSDNGFRICPEATTLEEVSQDCPNGVLYTGTFPQKQKVEGSDVTVSQASVSGVMYWIADGLVGTGGQGEVIITQEKETPTSTPQSSVTKVITQAVEGAITKTIESLDQTPLGNIEQEQLTTVAATTTAVTVSVSLASVLGNIGQLGYSISQVVINILSTLGFRRKRFPSGYVYDSVTRAPLQQAIVRIYDLSEKLVETSVTDGQGLFRVGLEAGDYILEVKKRNFSFPSRLIIGREDYPLSNVYHGEKIRLLENEINVVIPMDPKKDLSNQKTLTVIRSGISLILPFLNSILFLAGVTTALYVYNKESSLANLALLLLYIPTTYVLIKSFTSLGKKSGKVTYTDGTPASNITLVLKDKDFDKIVAKRVTDENGKYSFDISEKGEFVIETTDNSVKIVEGNTEIESKGKMLVSRKLKIQKI